MKWETKLKIWFSFLKSFYFSIMESIEKAFRQLSHLRNHIETHASEHAYACEVCGRTFKTKVCLRRWVTVFSLFSRTKNKFFSFPFSTRWLCRTMYDRCTQNSTNSSVKFVIVDFIEKIDWRWEKSVCFSVCHTFSLSEYFSDIVKRILELQRDSLLGMTSKICN